MKNNSFCIYGLNNSHSLLSSNKYIIESINFLSGGIASRDIKLKEKIKKLNISCNYLDKTEFNSKFNFKHAQGVVIEFYGTILKEFEDVKSNKKNICYIIIDKINDPQNLGQIIRTCECTAVDGIILPRHGSVHITNTVLQVSQGAFMNVDLFVTTNITNTISKLKNKGFWITAVENNINGKEWYDIDYTDKTAIVFGSEGKGIRKLVLNSCDFLATIPMLGKINSLNVSSAVSAILFERQRQITLKENLKN